MLRKLLPKQENFFNLFQRASQQLVDAAQQFAKMQRDLANAKVYANIIAEHEAAGDNIALATFDLLHKTFITPFDRHDIHQVTRQLDDILDLINRTAARITLYQLQSLPEGIEKIADLSVGAITSLKIALNLLENLKNAPDIIQYCRAISEADSQAESIMLEGVGKLFSDESDFKYLLKTKEIFEYSKLIISECHDLADVIKGIVLEYS